MPSSIVATTAPQNPRHSHSDIDPESDSRRIRLTFGYQERDQQPLSFSSLPHSPTACLDMTPAPLPTPSATSSSTFSSLPSPKSSAKITSIPSPVIAILTAKASTDVPALKNLAKEEQASKTIHRDTAPALADVSSSIPLRTSSMTSNISVLMWTPVSVPLASSSTQSSSRKSSSSPSRSCSPPPSRPASRCSSKGSMVSVSNSLDHRTMSRAAPSSKVTRSTGPYMDTLPDYEKALPSTPSPCSPQTQMPRGAQEQTQAPSRLQTRRPSMVERAAFLSSPPVRSRVAVSPRIKNMVPIPSSLISTSSPSLLYASAFPSSTLSLTCRGCANLSRSCQVVSLEKRRWSNDSTRGLHGAAVSSFMDGFETLSRGSSETDGDDSEEYEYEDRFSSPTLNDNDNDDDKTRSSSVANGQGKKKKAKKVKKRCPTLSLFNFMLKNKQQ